MFDYPTELALAQSPEDVWSLHCDAMNDFGFDRIIYGLTRVAAADGTLGEFEDAMVLSNHDRSYDDAFLASGLFQDAPGFRWARANTGAISWGALRNDVAALSEPERQVIAFQESAEVVAGITISLARTTPRTFAVASLTARPGLTQADVDRIWDEDGCRIWTMTTLMHLKLLSLPHRRTGTGAELSDRQREALEWVGEGKSYQDIAAIMGVSMATVEKHLRLAREKLRVSTTAQGVLKAAFQSRIYTAGSARRNAGLPAAPPGPCRREVRVFTET